jgi:hypothetical protein
MTVLRSKGRLLVMGPLCVWLAWVASSTATAQPASGPVPSPAAAPAPGAAASAAPSAGAFAAGLKAFDQGRHAEAFALWLPLAEQGRVEAQFNIAVMYEQGLGVAKDEAEAARWYLAAAERGDVAAQLKTGNLYEAGVGVPKDLGNASFWYGQAAKGAAKDAGAARQARARLAALPRDVQVGPEDVTEFEGGRFVLRRGAGNECIVALQGSVTGSASYTFDDVLKKAKAQGCARPLTLMLESPGGEVRAGLDLGRQVRDEGMRTVARYFCASSCGAIFLGGTERVLWGSRAQVGFHQIANPRSAADRHCVTDPESPAVVATKRYIASMIPDTWEQVWSLVINTPCRSIRYVKGEEALRLGVATRVEAEREDVFGPRAARIGARASAPR